MGLTIQSTGINIIKGRLKSKENSQPDVVIGLAGNPNTGKSTVFNNLTGLNQHTGNWPGKTVSNAQGQYIFKNTNFMLVDLPGTYSLLSSSVEEEVARDFICFGNADTTIVVADATCLERNLNLVLQVMEITRNTVLCVNLMDEAKRKKIEVDLNKLSILLGIPVVGTAARSGKGLNNLMEEVYKISKEKVKSTPYRISYPSHIEKAVEMVEPYIEELFGTKINSRFAALRLIEDNTILSSIEKHIGLTEDHKTILENKIQTVRDMFFEQGMHLEDIKDQIVSCVVKEAENIAKQTVTIKSEQYDQFDRKLDNIITSKMFGIPIMIGMLGLVFWLTIEGANYPSQLISNFLFGIEERLTGFFIHVNAPKWLHGILILGMYRTLAWVVSVMLPPMAIFFPLFTFLEDLGYLPRVAFNLDNYFKKACAHGKQALTMCMGFGCNAAGIVACRIIDSPRERLIAILTNNFVPCNGRFPTLIAMSAIFIGGAAAPYLGSLYATASVMAIVIFGIWFTLIISKILSKTILKGIPSSFTLELPPYRKPQIGRILIHSLLDRTLFVLLRAVTVAAPAGLFIWLMANIKISGSSILDHGAYLLQPLGHLMGMDGYILMAFILGLPANEIVIPIIVMSYMSTGYMLEMDSLSALGELLVANGWNWLTAVCVMLFSLMHFPCGTTLLTIKKETGSRKWTIASFLIPTITGIVICIIVAQTARLLGLA